jgi:DNA-binding IclR family transcriptional regulator
LERGLDVLELLASRRAALTQAEIARALGRTPAELFRTLTILDRRGYLQRDPASGAYRTTLRLFELGQAHQPAAELVRAAEAPMRALADANDESCHLAILHAGRVLTAAQADGAARVRLSVAVGSAIPPLQSASGRVLLAALDAADRDRLLAVDDDWRALDESGRSALRRRLATIRRRGYEAARGESVAGVSDLSVPIGPRGIRTQAALAVAALPRDHAAWVAATLPALRQTADAIADAAGLAGLGAAASEREASAGSARDRNGGKR